jgi:hypothetical protein
MTLSVQPANPGNTGLTMTGVAPGTYSNPTISVDGYGRITFASPGSPFPSAFTASEPVQVSTTYPQNISIRAASTMLPGAVQLNDTVSSDSSAQAATARAVKETYDVASQASRNAEQAANAAQTAYAQASSAQALASSASSNSATALSTANRAENEVKNALAAVESMQRVIQEMAATIERLQFELRYRG